MLIGTQFGKRESWFTIVYSDGNPDKAKAKTFFVKDEASNALVLYREYDRAREVAEDSPVDLPKAAIVEVNAEQAAQLARWAKCRENVFSIEGKGLASVDELFKVTDSLVIEASVDSSSKVLDELS